jgi:hypothetical protein
VLLGADKLLDAANPSTVSLHVAAEVLEFVTLKVKGAVLFVYVCHELSVGDMRVTVIALAAEINNIPRIMPNIKFLRSMILNYRIPL